MSKIAHAFLLSVVGGVSLFPLGDIIASTGGIYRRNGFVVLGLAFTVSMIQLVGEYWVVDRAGTGLGRRIERWWQNSWIRADLGPFMRIMRPVLQAGGYTTMCISCLNPIGIIPPFGRLTAVTIWRSAKLPGSVAIIVFLSFVRLVAFFAGFGVFAR